MKVNTYPEMNKKIVSFLRGSEINFAIYAAQRIEELEEVSRDLIDILEEAHELEFQYLQGCTVTEKIERVLQKAKGML